MRPCADTHFTCSPPGRSLGPALAGAHHGIANIDHNEDVAITGVIAEVAFINPHSWSNLMYSEQLHVTERFRLDPDTMTLTREYVAVDPLYFTGEYRGSDTLRLADVPYRPYDCDDRTRAE